MTRIGIRSLLRPAAAALAAALVLSPAVLNYSGAAQTRPYRVTDRQVREILSRVGAGTARFRASLNAALGRSTDDGARAEGDINRLLSDFESATDRLRSLFKERASLSFDVENLLRRAADIDDFMARRGLSPKAQKDWAVLKGDLSRLASAYNVAWSWDTTSPPGGDAGAAALQEDFARVFRGNLGIASQLTGTFFLDRQVSDDATTVVVNAVRNLPDADRARVREQLLRRLEAPEMLAIERSGNSVTIASSRAPQTTFMVNAGESREQLPSGAYSRVSSELVGDRLVVRSTGDRKTDFTVTFEPINEGRRLRVTREIWNERLGADRVVIQGVYDRISNVAEWGVYNSTPYDQTRTYSSVFGDFVVPDGQMLTARLDTDLSTRTAQSGDRFTMTVTSPAQFDGAVIEGHVASATRPDRVTGRSDMSLNFDTIRYQGRTYQFAGFIDSIRTQGGQTVQVDNGGTVRDDNHTTVQRAAIGPAVGAIIGAIAGGGKGAAIGAILGAGGVSSSSVRGDGDIILASGSELDIRASAPLDQRPSLGPKQNPTPPPKPPPSPTPTPNKHNHD